MAPQTIVYGKYQLLELLARGGMGEVWKARSRGVEGFEKILVIKRILPDLSKNPRFVDMFIDEAKIAVTLTHANIVQVFDLGMAEGTYFIAMEYVPGFDLGTVLGWTKKLGRPLPPDLSVYIVSELAKGLDYAHRRRDAELRPLGIVHRDVSPENVLLSFEGEVKLTDFGIARTRGNVPGLPALPPGKFAYLSPEQARGEPVDGRADLFALGAVLCEMLTGVRPLEAETPEATFARARSGDFPALHALRPDLPGELAQILARATAVDREQRYENAGGLYEDLIQFLYESGRRVGAHDLGRALEELATAAAERPSAEQLAAGSGIEEVFGEPANTGMTTARGVTPLQVPTRTTNSSLPAPPASIPPRSEWRDVSVLAIDGLPRAEVMAFALRYGGLGFPGTQPSDVTLVVFGLAEADGRDAQAAARCALRVVRNQPGGRGRGVVHSGRLLLDPEGRARHEQPIEALRSEARKWLARVAVGCVAASPAAAKLLRGRFELAPAQGDGPREIERERRADEGIGKFVGRRDELRQVGEAFALANRGKLRVVGLKGEAGSGKSRLLMETARRLSHAGHDVGLYVATCSPEGRSIPFQAIQELLRVVLGVEDMEPEPRLRDKVERLRLLGLTTPQREAVGRVLGLGLHTSSVPSTVTLEHALIRVAYKLAQDKLTVFAWDGVESMDAASRELIGKLLRNPLDVRVVVLLAYRPSDPGPWVGAENFHEVALRPLAVEDVARLARHRLLANDVPDELVRELQSRAGGNPLYVEELLNAMRESAAVDVKDGVVQMHRTDEVLELPRTLRGLIGSRVGKLSANHRVILQLAVTFGPRFVPELLAQAASQDEPNVRQALSVLEERGIVRALGPSDFAFAHDLVREVLYDSIPLEERPSLHAAVAAAIETMRPAERDAAVDRLAYHHRHAGHREQAVGYLIRAAERFEGEAALGAAVDAYLQAIDLLSAAPDPDREHLLTLYRRAGEMALRTRAVEIVADRLEAALQLAERTGRDDYVARFSMLRGRLLHRASRLEEGRSWLERARLLAGRRGDRALQRDVALTSAEAHARNGEYRDVIHHVRDALELARNTDDASAQIRCLLLVAPAYAAVGQAELARSTLREIQDHAGAGDRLLEVEVHRTRALVLHLLGDREGMLESGRRALELAKEYGLPHEMAVTAHTLGEFYLRVEEDKRAFAALRLSHEIASEHGYVRVRWLNVCLLGFLDVLRFDADQGRGRMLEALRYAEQHGYVWDTINGKYLLAIVEQKIGHTEAARVALRHVVSLADRHGHERMRDDAEQALASLDRGQAIALPR